MSGYEKNIPTTYWDEAVEVMTKSGIAFDRGLSDHELRVLERELAIRFPPDLIAFLRTALPVGRKFPDWRGPLDDLRTWIAAPVEGVLDGVREANFWCASWGEKPTEQSAAVRRAERICESAPAAIPLFMHRFMPGEPCESNNPVFSAHQFDIIRYSSNLRSYLLEDFWMPRSSVTPENSSAIAFWDEVVVCSAEYG